jgi:hypothetical protein
LDAKRRETWKSSKEELTSEKRTAICNKLLEALRSYDTSDDGEKEHLESQGDSINSSNGIEEAAQDELVTLPTDTLELFWLLNINDIPIFKSELPNTIKSIENID